MLNLVFLLLACVCYTVSQLWAHGKIYWSSDPYSFWGSLSDKRKYKLHFGSYLPAPDNWYYKTFGIEHKERFPGSATVFVWLTDGYHFSQFLFIKFLLLAIIFNDYPATIWNFLGCAIVWYGTFNICYRQIPRLRL